MSAVDIPQVVINEIKQQVRAPSGMIHAHVCYGGILHGFTKQRISLIADYKVVGRATVLTDIIVYRDVLVNIAHSEPQYISSKTAYHGMHYLYNNQIFKYAIFFN